MIFYYKIMLGMLIGLIVGTVNFYLMRAFLRLALKISGRIWGVLIIISSYLLRYLLIAVVVFSLVKNNEATIGITVLAVLGILTMVLAVWQQKRRLPANKVTNGRD